VIDHWTLDPPPQMKFGLQSYLRNLAVRLSRIAARCPDAQTASEILKVCDELADKLEALEKLFAVPERIE
jgi:hypothetical protein